MPNARLRSTRYTLCALATALLLVFSSIAPVFAADPPAGDGSVPTEPTATTVLLETTASPEPTIASDAPSPSASPSVSPSPEDSGSPTASPPDSTPTSGDEPTMSLLAAAATETGEEETGTPAPSATPEPGAPVVTTAIATAAGTLASDSATEATPTVVAASGQAEAGATTIIEQYNIQIIQGSPDPEGAVVQSAANSVVANQQVLATSGAAEGAIVGSGSTAQSGGVLAIATAIIRQINIQIVTALGSDGAATQTADNLVVLGQDVEAATGNATAEGGTGTTGDAAAGASASVTQKNIQIYIGDHEGPLTAAEVIALVLRYLAGPSLSDDGGAAGVEQRATDTSEVTQQVSAVVGQPPTGTPGTGPAVSVGSGASSTNEEAGISPSASVNTMSGDALINALVFIGQINVQLISSIFGGEAVQSASNKLIVDQVLAAQSGNAASSGGAAESGGARIGAEVTLNQTNAQATLSGTGGDAVAAQNDVIGAIIRALFGSASPSASSVVRQSAANEALVQQDLRIPGTPTPTPVPDQPPAQDQSSGSNAPSQPVVQCAFAHGFKALHDAIPDVVGECRTNEVYAGNGDAVQLTTNGILVWRKADNYTAFTDGRSTWVLGLLGIQVMPLSDWYVTGR